MPTLRHLGIQRSCFNTVQEVIDTVRTQKDVLRSIEIRRTCIPSVVDLLAVLQRELPCLENVEFEENTVGPWDDVWFRWADGEYDRGRHAREMVEEKGVRQTLDEMIAGLRLDPCSRMASLIGLAICIVTVFGAAGVFSSRISRATTDEALLSGDNRGFST
ncbi:Cytochrome p450 protein [Lasiodiplodia theobromae]|uniref:Cytochrome p450 protein n=1 Tax=Lasiodiplodia theobromae TaxID=45133 RepID=UPI0015C39D47|nr:Cytochrome p450 protein [Lasiodiplodia theobromae]KAF4541549.1 Cytochrome p450 protein [Lasiodiplodia theobromae]